METVNIRSAGAELADVFRSCGKEFLSGHRLTTCQHKASAAIISCRTSQMGSHALTCDHCGHTKVCYNSCRNRHCPKCQYVRQLLWVEKLKVRLLPVRYFHVVFTVPEVLRPLFYLNQKICYDLLFASSAMAVRKTSENPEFLGAHTGSLAVLHTWGQSLSYHPHIHMLVPAGGLDQDGMEWIPAHRKFFVPVKALSAVFRGVFFSRLKRLLDQNSLTVPRGSQEQYADIGELRKVLYEKNWHVYIKKTFRGAGQVVSYLGRYTHRVAISNSRILELGNTEVSFRWKDYRSGTTKVMKLATGEFVRRFLQHILPGRFYKIRYYGILSSAASDKLRKCFSLLNLRQPYSPYQGLNTYQVLEAILGNDTFVCECCKEGKMVFAVPETEMDST